MLKGLSRVATCTSVPVENRRPLQGRGKELLRRIQPDLQAVVHQHAPWCKFEQTCLAAGVAVKTRGQVTVVVQV